MSRPVSFNCFKRLFEKERKILTLGKWNCQTFNVNMRVLLWKLLKKDDQIVFLIKHLKKALFIIRQLSQHIFIESNRRLLMLHWGQNEMPIFLESFSFRKGQINIIWSTNQPNLLIIWAENAIILDFLWTHDWTRLVWPF